LIDQIELKFHNLSIKPIQDQKDTQHLGFTIYIHSNRDKPFLDEAYSKPNEAYWKHVDTVVNLALKRNILLALSLWSDKLYKASRDTGLEIFNSKSEYDFSKWIGKRYANKKNIIWVLGGDRNPREESDDIEVWNQMTKGILETQNPNNKQLMT
jgi:hypothetical protein